MTKAKPSAKVAQGTGKQNEATAAGAEISFTCKVCGQSRPINEMRLASQFFPPLVICRECEKSVR